jgi:hypothetical protein
LSSDQSRGRIQYLMITKPFLIATSANTWKNKNSYYAEIREE